MKTYRKSDYFKPIEECSREEDEDGVSEYNTMIAISRMNDEFTEDELKKELVQVIVNQTISGLVDKGLFRAVWDPTCNDFRFYAA